VMGDFFAKPLNWLWMGVGIALAAMTAFVVFQPVKVVPRIAYGPEYSLVDQRGETVTPEDFAGRFVLFGFGYTSDPTGTLDRTLADMRAFEDAVIAEGMAGDVTLALILFDEARDTTERRAAFAAERGLDDWLLLGGEASTVKRVIGQGFGVYYEAVPLADLVASQPQLADRLDGPPAEGEMAYLQAERYMLVGDQNFVRADYRAPLDLEIALRDVRLMAREKEATGAAHAVNEAAHLFLCYP
jgi:cytochrome oxidase Cu insertion factor (SCO1/SenC/PrrC family)